MKAFYLSCCLLFISFGVWAQTCTITCPTCPAGTPDFDEGDNLNGISLGNDDKVQLSGNFNGDISISANISGGQTAYICIDNGVTVNAGSFVVTNSGSGDVIVINNGILNTNNEIQVNEDVQIYNCGTMDINGGNGMQIKEDGEFYNLGDIDMEGNLQVTENAFLCNNSQITIEGNFQNEGEVVSPAGSCGAFNIDDTGQNVDDKGELGETGGDIAINICPAGNFDDENANETGAGVDISCGAMCPPNILPVTFLYFKANKAETAILTQWATTSEINNAYFSLEKSHNGFDFQDIGRVEGAGSTEAEQTYQFLDTEPYQGTNYYRLRQVDIDGTTSFSQIAVVHFRSHADLEVKIYPNPNAADVLSLEFQHFTFEEEVFIRMTNLAGKVVQEHSTRLQSPTLTLSQPLPQGIYLIQIRSGNALVQKQYVKY